MSSRSSVMPRRKPQQERGQRRVDRLLRAAACVIGKAGYQPATMCAIAESADSSIGSLYQFFPNKEAVAEALRARYIGETEPLWDALAREAEKISVGALVSKLIRTQIGFAESHPAFLALLDAPPTVNSWQRRELMRKRIARVLTARNRQLSRAEALRFAAVVQQILRGLLALYAKTPAGEKEVLIEEFEAVLEGYLGEKLSSRSKRSVKCEV